MKKMFDDNSKMEKQLFHPGMRAFGENVWVSNDVKETGCNLNDLIIGGPGSGKTGGYIFQQLLNPDGSIVVSDTKGALCSMFRSYLEQIGYKVIVLDFVKPERSIPYNPMSVIRKREKGGYHDSDYMKLAFLLTQARNDRDVDQFWRNAAARYISMLMSFTMEAMLKEDRNMYTVAKLHRQFSTKRVREMMLEWCNRNPGSFFTHKFTELEQSMNADKTWACIMEFANEALEPFGYEDYRPLFGKPDSFDATILGKEKTVMFVNCSDSDLSLHVMTNLVNMQILQSLISYADDQPNNALPIPVRLIMDDFAAGPKLDNFDNIISIIRSRNISVSVILQSINQLYGAYGRDKGETIIDNCDHILCLKTNNPETKKYMAESLNVLKSSVNEILKDKAILISAGDRARVIDKLKPYPVDVRSLASEMASAAKVDEDYELKRKVEELAKGKYEYIDTRTPEILIKEIINQMESNINFDSE